MNRGLLLLLLLLNSAPTFAQQPSDATTALPVTPTVLPPQVPPRPPLISVPNGTIMPIQLNSPQKESLAWRARAHRLRSSTTAQQQVCTTTYDAAIMNLISVLSASGLRVQTLNSKAGELLAVPVDSRTTQKYVFVVSEMPPGTVTVKAAPWSPSKNAAALLDSILQTLAGQQFAGTQRSTR